MPSINMIAPKRAEKLRRERDMRRLVFGIMAELVVAFALTCCLVIDIHSMNTRIAALDKQIDALQPVVDEIKQYDAATCKLQPKLQLLNEAMSVTMRWYNTLNKLTETLPASTYLVKVSSDDAGGPGAKKDDTQRKVVISGVSATQALVGEAMLRMQTMQDVTDVELHYTRDASPPDYHPVYLNGRLSNNPRRTMGVEFEIGSQLNLTDTKGAKADGGSQT